MKRVFAIAAAFAVGFALSSFAEIPEKSQDIRQAVKDVPNCTETIYSPHFRSVYELHQWGFSNHPINQQKIGNQVNLQKTPYDSLVLFHAYTFTETRFRRIPGPYGLALYARYFYNTNAIAPAVSLTIKKWNILAYGGTGIGNSPIISKNEDKIRMQSLKGLGIERAFNKVFFIEPFGGFSYFVNTPKTGYKYIGNIDAYLGGRYNLGTGKIGSFGIEAFAGLTAWNSNIKMELAKNNWFFLGGGFKANLILTSPQLYLLPIEAGGLMSLQWDMVQAKTTIPFKISKRSSIGLTVMGGIGIGGDFNNMNSLGFEWRRYADILKPYFNPVLGIYWGQWDIKKAATAGENLAIYLGNKFRLIDQLSLDVFGTASAWSSPWPRSIISNNPLPQPADFDFSAGLTYYFKPKKEVYNTIKTIAEDDYNKLINEKGLPPSYHTFLTPETKGDTLIEQLVFVAKKIKSKRSFGDLTDIKFYKTSLNVGIDFNPFNNEMKEGHFRTNNVQLLLALFDKEKSDVEAIKSYNMFLHFYDIEHCRYFGYRFDKNRRLQPECRDLGELNTSDFSKPIFYGKYEDYVQQFKWLDESTIESVRLAALKGDMLAKDLLSILDEFHSSYKDDLLIDPTPGGYKKLSDIYRIAFVIYPSERINQIEKVCGENYGVTIMFRDEKDNPDPKKQTGFFAATEDPNVFVLDFGDDAFFSNMVRGPEIKDIGELPNSKKIKLTHFDLGKYELKNDHVTYLKTKIDSIFTNYGTNYKKVEIYGYADATVFLDKDGKPNYRLNQELSRNRAEVVKKFIVDNGFVSENMIVVEGKGIASEAREKDPYNRKVEIIFIY